MVRFFSFFLFAVIFLIPKVCSAHSQVQIIEMTANGFVPQEVTIDENSTVIFINKDTQPHWPASDIHPTHEIYPEFDPKRPIKSGESWPFKPKVGQWRFHDHLFPHFNGKLIVTAEVGLTGNRNGFNLAEEFKKISAIFFTRIKQIFYRGQNFPILSREAFTQLSPQDQFKALKDLADAKGGASAWEYIKSIYKGQAGSSGNIHDLAHLAGGLIYDDKGFSGIGQCSNDFGFGCFHGFLDKAFAKSIDKLQDADQACLKLDTSLSGPVASCIHGIGHGVASFFSVSDLKKSLSTCRKLEAGSQYCFDGVFMEFARNAPVSYIKKDDPLYPCDNLEKEFGYAYSQACGRNQPSLLMSRFKMSFDQVVSVCLSSDSTAFKEACIDSLGFSLVGSGNAEKIIQGCQIFTDSEYAKRCLKSAAGELVFQNVPGWAEKSKTVCLSLPYNKEECLDYVNKLATDYHRK